MFQKVISIITSFKQTNTLHDSHTPSTETGWQQLLCLKKGPWIKFTMAAFIWIVICVKYNFQHHYVFQSTCSHSHSNLKWGAARDSWESHPASHTQTVSQWRAWCELAKLPVCPWATRRSIVVQGQVTASPRGPTLLSWQFIPVLNKVAS